MCVCAQSLLCVCVCSIIAGDQCVCLLVLQMEAIKKKLASLKDEKEAALESKEEAEALLKEADARADAVSHISYMYISLLLYLSFPTSSVACILPMYIELCAYTLQCLCNVCTDLRLSLF